MCPRMWQHKRSVHHVRLCCVQMRGVLITLRMRLYCEIVRRGRTESESAHEVLNEVVVDRGANPYLTKIECYEKGRLITKVSKPSVY